MHSHNIEIKKQQKMHKNKHANIQTSRYWHTWNINRYRTCRCHSCWRSLNWHSYRCISHYNRSASRLSWWTINFNILIAVSCAFQHHVWFVIDRSRRNTGDLSISLFVWFSKQNGAVVHQDMINFIVGFQCETCRVCSEMCGVCSNWARYSRMFDKNPKP